MNLLVTKLVFVPISDKETRNQKPSAHSQVGRLSTVDSRHSWDSSWKARQTQKSELQIAALVSRYSQKQAKSQRQPVHAGCLKGGHGRDHGMSIWEYEYEYEYEQEHVCIFLPLNICIGMTWKGIYWKFSLSLSLSVSVGVPRCYWSFVLRYIEMLEQ